MVWTKNSEKNSKCSHWWDLSIELLDIEFRALKAHKSRTSEFEKCQNHLFSTLNLVSGARCGSKILKKNPDVPLTNINIDGVKFRKFSLKP